MARTCSKLGIRLIFTRPYSPEATGKVERFNRVVDLFLSEATLEKQKTLNRLNELFQVWLSECNQNKHHSALENKMSPKYAYYNHDGADSLTGTRGPRTANVSDYTNLTGFRPTELTSPVRSAIH